MIKLINHTHVLKKLSFQELKVGMNVFKNNLKIKHNESVLIVTDFAKEKLEAAIFFETAKKFTSKVELVCFSGMKRDGQEPPEIVSKKMQQADICLLVTTYSLSHTRARKKATEAGTRIISLPGITHEMILRTFLIDFKKMGKLAFKLKKILDNGNKVFITSSSGTNLTLSLGNRKALCDIGDFSKPGSIGNLPAGEVFIAPLEEKTNGRIVFDGAFTDIELDEPICVEIVSGKIVSIKGGNAARRFEFLINQIGDKGKIVCEFGIGINKATKLTSNILEAEKVYGTCHIAFGNNFNFGGKNLVEFHTDGVIKKPTIIIDGETIVRSGKILVGCVENE